MTGIPGENNPESGDAGGQEQVHQPLQEELKSSLAWLEHAALVAADLARLGLLELRLAAGDSGRLVVLGLAMIPILLLAWIGVSVLVGWSLFVWINSVALAIAGFIAVQLITLGIMALLIKKYVRSLSFPVTNQRLRALKEQANGSEEATKADSGT